MMSWHIDNFQYSALQIGFYQLRSMRPKKCIFKISCSRQRRNEPQSLVKLALKTLRVFQLNRVYFVGVSLTQLIY